MTGTKPHVLTRSCDPVTTDRMDGTVVQVRRHTVTLIRTPAGLVDHVDGEPCDLHRAVTILQYATQTTVTHEFLEPAPSGRPAPTSCTA